jgi:hypothetical protein
MGASIPNALVIIHWDPVGLDGVTENIGTKDDRSSSTDALGHFSAELAPGVYDVFLSAAGFSPHCEKILIKGSKPNSYSAKLKVSRMLTIKLE